MVNMSDSTIKQAKELGVKIGNDCKIGAVHWGTEPYLISIGNHCSISYHVDFITHDGGTWLFRQDPEYKGIMKLGYIKIKDNCYIGAHTIILPGVIIGENCIVGAGSVVTKSLKPNGVYAGNPAKYICSLEEYKQKCVENHKKYNKNFIKSENRQERILSLLEGYDEYKPYI